MANSITHNLLFKREYLKEFLISFSGNQYPIETNEKEFIGKLMIPIFETPPKVPDHIRLQKKLRQLNQEFNQMPPGEDRDRLYKKINHTKNLVVEYREGSTVMINIKKIQGLKIRNMKYISFSNMRWFENVVHSFFKEVFYLYIDAKMEAGFTQADAINHFCYRYNIPMNKITFSTLKKKHYRYKKMKQEAIDNNNNKSAPKMSRSLSRSFTHLQIGLNGLH